MYTTFIKAEQTPNWNMKRKKPHITIFILRNINTDFILDFDNELMRLTTIISLVSKGYEIPTDISRKSKLWIKVESDDKESKTVEIKNIFKSISPVFLHCKSSNLIDTLGFQKESNIRHP